MLSQHLESRDDQAQRARRPELEPGAIEVLSKLFLISWLHRFIVAFSPFFCSAKTSPRMRL
jgi:hypothetical protein